MIYLICTHCQAALNIDDGFAGGVCRCQHCGTIQTVPKKPKRDATKPPDRSSDAVAAGSGPRAKRLRKKTFEYSSLPVPLFQQRRVQIAILVVTALLAFMVVVLVFRRPAVTPRLTPATTPAAGSSGA